MVKPLIYGKPNCVNCDKTKGKFNDLGVEYDVVDITKDKEALMKIKSLGFKEAPVVVTEFATWSGYQEGKIMEHFSSQNDDDTWDF